MHITVIGTGYVGLVTGACFSKMGNKVYCVDVVEEKINGLKKGILPIYEPNLDTLVISSQEKGDLIFTTDIKEALDDSNIIFIAVGTPMDEDGSANLDDIFSVATDIANSEFFSFFNCNHSSRLSHMPSSEGYVSYSLSSHANLHLTHPSLYSLVLYSLPSCSFRQSSLPK